MCVHVQVSKVDGIFDNSNDYMTLPDLTVSLTEELETGDDLFRVCNRQKPVFKPSHCWSCLSVPNRPSRLCGC